MADKKITQFPDFDGTPDSGVFFIVASGDTSDPNSSNYRFPFDGLSTEISQAGSPWKTGSDFLYTTTGKVGVGLSDPEYQLDVAAGTGRFRGDVIISGDLDVSGTTRVHKIIDVTTTGDFSGSGLHFASGYFSEILTISGVPVSTGVPVYWNKNGDDLYYDESSNSNRQWGFGTSSPRCGIDFIIPGGAGKGNIFIGSDRNELRELDSNDYANTVIG